MSWCLFLDDERIPKTKKDWIIARSYLEAINLIKSKGCPELISFDHDLGENVQTGYDLAKWIVEQDLEFNILPHNFNFFVHSANPVGRDNILSLLNGYLKFKQKEKIYE